MQHGAASGNGGIDREDAFGEGWQHLRFQPPAQDRTLCRIASFGEEHPDLQLLDGDRRDEHAAAAAPAAQGDDVRESARPALAFRSSDTTFVSSRNISSGPPVGEIPGCRGLEFGVRLVRAKAQQVDDALLTAGQPLVVLEGQQHMRRAAPGR